MDVDEESEIRITATGANSVTTTGNVAHGVYATRRASGSNSSGAGDIIVDVENIVVTTEGAIAVGIYGQHQGVGDIAINVRNATITTRGTDFCPNRGNTSSYGILAQHRNRNLGDTPLDEVRGNINVDVQGGTIETMGSYSHGIYGIFRYDHYGGEISILMGGGNTITTTGADAHGVVAYHSGTMQETSRISIDVGAVST